MHQSPWPTNTTRVDGVLHVGGVSVLDLAREHGSPLWVVDEDDFRERCRAYVESFPGVNVAYASKAWCVTGLLQIADEEGLWVDVATGGELYTAEKAGVPPERIVFHGNNKSRDELRMAARMGVARIVVDSFDELMLLDHLGDELDHTFTCWLRITPGIDAHTHEYVRTGHDDSKFGFSLSLGLADDAISQAKELANVDIVGAHAHIGSQIFGTDPFIANAEVMLGLVARWRDEHGIELAELNLGGGMGIRYTHEDHPVAIARYGEAMLQTVDEECRRLGLERPQLFIEPGRALVAPSTITLYTVGTIKHLQGLRTYVSVDGGMSDNIRPALYQALHEIALASRVGVEDLAAVTIVGKHCESGDLVREHAALPADLRVGDLIAVAATGAYTASMASNYNRLPRPGAVLVKDGEVRPLMRRETYADVAARDLPLR